MIPLFQEVGDITHTCAELHFDDAEITIKRVVVGGIVGASQMHSLTEEKIFGEVFGSNALLVGLHNRDAMFTRLRAEFGGIVCLEAVAADDANNVLTVLEFHDVGIAVNDARNDSWAGCGEESHRIIVR